MSKILFQETQKFNQWWLYLIVAASAIVILFSFGMAIRFSSNDATSIAIGIGGAIALLVVCSILYMKLTTTITEEKINIHFYPFLKRQWKWNELKTAKVLDYGFVGGWGIRLWTGMGTVYNVRGSKGLHLKTDKKEYVIGTQKEEELRSSIAHLVK